MTGLKKVAPTDPSRQVDTSMGGTGSEGFACVPGVPHIYIPPSPSDDSDNMGSRRSSCDIFATEFSWIARLSTMEFFHPCSIHADVKKNECNYFCSTCTDTPALCRHCVQEYQFSDSNEVLLQIRKYMYRYVVHLDDLSRHYDCSGIQSYIINQRKAVLLNPKDVPANVSGAPTFENQCVTCKVPLRPDCLYCCLDCKVAVRGGSIIPQTPQSMKVMKKQAPRVSKRVSSSSGGSVDTYSPRKRPARDGKPCRPVHRKRKCLPTRSALE